MNNRGFTLLEVIISIMILGFIAIGTHQFISSILSTDEIVDLKVKSLLKLQKALYILDQDYSQMVPRSSRLDGQSAKRVMQVGDKMFQSDDVGITFSRGGSINPGALLPKSEIVRVWYRLKDKKLQRATYPFSDTIIGFTPEYIDILDNVKKFKVLFYKQGIWNKTWADQVRVPEGVKIEIETVDYGDITRVYNIISGESNGK
ncbi:MAG: type II secretion system minor pseudopilin GspJ [Succinivibrionaceae bacterium]